ncbi:MAG: single-stranded DNA-binding protein [Bacteroides sp.]
MSVNKAIILGNVGQDPDVKSLDNGIKVANFSIATTERGYTLKNGTQVPERTEWHNIVVWRGLAEIVEKYVKKGTKLYIEGKIKTRSYEDQNKAKRYITEIYAEQLELLGGRPQEQKNSLQEQVQQRAEQFAQENAPKPITDDDLPF